MRELTTHHTNAVNSAISVTADDRDQNNGNASHQYCCSWDGGSRAVNVDFQQGPIGEAGVNGITNEILLAIVIDRIEGFQSGKFANRFNEEALMHVKHALEVLEARTKEREARGVEGTHTV